MSQTLSCDSHYDPSFSSGKENNGRQLLVVVCLYGLKKLRTVGRGADQHRWGTYKAHEKHTRGICPWPWPLLWPFSEAPALLLGQSPLGLESPAATSHPDHVLFLLAPSICSNFPFIYFYCYYYSVNRWSDACFPRAWHSCPASILFVI